MTPSEIAKNFDVEGTIVATLPLGSGNVNDTYRVISRTTFSETQFVLQRINQAVFPRPDLVMQNIRRATNHAHTKIRSEANSADRVWQLPQIIPNRDGSDFFIDPEGKTWRAMTLIASASSREQAETPEHTHQAGAVLGHFHRMIADIPIAQLADTLPGFHITTDYLKHYDEQFTTDSGKKRAEASMTARGIRSFIEDRRDIAGILEDAERAGELKARPMHGDPKISNIMIDDLTGKGTAIVDLDTVKPGLVHYDIGDAIRSSCNPLGEETPDLKAVHLDLSLCETFLKGYLNEAAAFLTPRDYDFIYDSIRLITFELGLRFFADYLAGNVYFKVQQEEQNLHRAAVQMALCESIEDRKAQVTAVIESLRPESPTS